VKPVTLKGKVTIEERWADNQIDRLPGLVDELVRRPVNVIVANVLATRAAKNATTAIPIVFVTGSDPVKDGFVTSLNRPGGKVCLRRTSDEAAGDFAPART
jgi:putative ABC transport system substrate-binding protein